MDQDADELWMVWTTLPNEDAAVAVGREAVDARLAACASCLPAARSIYRYGGETHDDTETLLLLKTRRGRYAELEAWLMQKHPYDVPEIIAFAAAAVAAPYAHWLREGTCRA